MAGGAVLSIIGWTILTYTGRYTTWFTFKFLAKLWSNLGSWYQRSKDKLTFKKRLSRIPDLEKLSVNPENVNLDYESDDDGP